MMITRQKWLTVLISILIFLGIYFRVTNISQKIYWHDEVYTSLRVAGYQETQIIDTFFHGKIIKAGDLLTLQTLDDKTPLSSTINALSKNPEHPPLYYLLLRFWQNIFGSSITINRSLSVIFSLLVLPTIYYLSQLLFHNYFISLITVGLVAISPVQILYAQEAREYSLWMLLITISTVLLFQAISKNKISLWVSYSFSLALTLYTSILANFFLLVNIIYSFLLKFNLHSLKVFDRANQDLNRDGKLGKNIDKKIFIFTVASYILFIPWFVIMILNFDLLQQKTNWVYLSQSFSLLVNIWLLHFTSLFIDFNLPLYNGFSYIFITFIFGLIIYSFYFFIKNTESYISSYFLLLIIIPLGSLILPDLILGGVRSIMTRYFFPCYLGIYVIIGYTLGKKNQNKSKVWSIILVILFSLSILSNIVSQKAFTWWHKAPSYHNYTIAKIINQDSPQNSLLITEDFEINKGNIISLSHNLNSEISLQLIPLNMDIKPYSAYKNIYIFNPSNEFREKIEKIYDRKLILVNPFLYQLN